MKLKIGPLTNLQDARYGAAVGMSLMSFSLARGDNSKLSGATVWNMSQWLEGPALVLDMNAESLDELDGLGVDPRYLSFPLEDYELALFNYAPAIIVLADSSLAPARIAEMVMEAKAAGHELKVEIELKADESPQQFAHVAPHVLLHFASLELADQFIAQPLFEPYGISFGKEAEEEPEVLDYEKLDDIAARFTDVHL
ncbi:MAG: hypothetical protein AB8F95_05090 [Bacteroidia bacterium]